MCGAGLVLDTVAPGPKRLCVDVCHAYGSTSQLILCTGSMVCLFCFAGCGFCCSGLAFVVRCFGGHF